MKRLRTVILASLAIPLVAAVLAGIASAQGSAGNGPTSAAPPASGPSPSHGQPAGQDPSKYPVPPGSTDLTTKYPNTPALRSLGQTLYGEGCSSCHGIALQGEKGVAPSLRQVGAGSVDFYLSTGRMPLQDPAQQPADATPLYNRHQMNALIAYITSFGGPPAPAVNLAQGNLAQGFRVFDENCAGCHSIVARGGMTVGAWVPSLQNVNALQIAEAVRTGPYLMPHFDDHQIDQHQLDSLVKYVLWTRHPADNGGLGIDNIGPVPEGIVAWFVALLAMVIVARLIGERERT